MFAIRKSGVIGNRSSRRLGIERLEDRRLLSGQSLFTAPAPPIYGPLRPPVTAPQFPGKLSVALVSGQYQLTDIGSGDTITSASGPETGFILSGAPVGATYTYSVTSSGGGTPIIGSGAVGSIAPQYVTGIDVAMLHNGILAYTVHVFGGAASFVVTATTTLDQTAPANYAIYGPGAITLSNDSNTNIPNEASNTRFTFVNAELGAAYSYIVTSSGGGTPVTGVGTVANVEMARVPTYPGEIIPDYVLLIPMVTGINVSSLHDGTLTFTVIISNGAGSGAPVTATATLAHRWLASNVAYGPTPPFAPLTLPTL